MGLIVMQLKTRKDKKQQIATVDCDTDAMLEQLANETINDSQLLSVIDSMLTELVFRQENLGIKHYSIKITSEYLYDKLRNIGHGCTPYAAKMLNPSVQSLKMTLKSKFPQAQLLPDDAFYELTPLFYKVLMRKLTKKINAAGYQAKYHSFLDYIAVY